MARARAGDARRGGDPRRARPLVPRGRDDRGARARRRAGALLLGPVARVAPRTGGPRRRGREDGRADRGRHRAARALRRALPLQEVEGEAGAGQADTDRATRARSGGRPPTSSSRSLASVGRSASRSSVPLAPVAWCSRPTTWCSASRRRSSCCEDATLVLERGEHVALVGPNGSGKTTLLETVLGEREPEAGRIRLGHGVVPAYFSQHEAELPQRGTVLDAAMAGTGLSRPDAQSLLGRFLFTGWDAHEKPVSVLSGGERRRLALALVVASGAEPARARRADEPPRPREPRGARGCARGLPGHGAARLARPRRPRRRARPHRRGRGRQASLLRRRLGRSRPPAGGGGGAGAAARREAEEASQAEHGQRPARPAPERARPRRGLGSPSSSATSPLWRRSSPPTGATWTSSPRIARPATSCRRQLARWEELFEAAQDATADSSQGTAEPSEPGNRLLLVRAT